MLIAEAHCLSMKHGVTPKIFFSHGMHFSSYPEQKTKDFTGSLHTYIPAQICPLHSPPYPPRCINNLIHVRGGEEPDFRPILNIKIMESRYVGQHILRT